ncbi:hypothetical protein G4Y73_02780 [Wenzhouxiangella sp. XN201]|uniref:hypothetical protein n=1 Tax=Wenzhouxiangella sp. XN201 TaxID=2710755 RepID=UPI0013C83498|nr:hypothetical protein [Wenzhouxiangella sp. XN201]NEZ03072.1 hypothetical protein [Wenzhouxiangella sp. XN201]
MAQGVYRYFLKFFFRGQVEPLVAEVLERERDRVREIVAANPVNATNEGFLCFDTVDGKSVAVNPNFVQVLHILFEPSFPSGPGRYEGPVLMYMRDADDPFETFIEDPEQAYDLFFHLENGPDVVPAVSFDDEDGEQVIIAARELLFIVIPRHVLEEGRQLVEEDM